MTKNSSGWGSKKWMEQRFQSLDVFDGDKWGHSFRWSQKYRLTQTLFLIKPYLFSRRRLRVLDIGCALCDFTKQLVNVRPENDYFATDISRRAIAFDQKQFPNIEFKCEALPKLSYPDQSFDLISTLEVICYLDSKARQEAIFQIHRCLKKNGLFLFSTVIDNGQRYFDQGQINKLMRGKFQPISKKTLNLRQFHYLEKPYLALVALDKIYRSGHFLEIEAYLANKQIANFLKNPSVSRFLFFPIKVMAKTAGTIINNRTLVVWFDQYAPKIFGSKAVSLKIIVYRKT